MTVYATTNRWSPLGDGSSTTFPYTNRIFVAGDLRVFVNGALKNLGSDYTVTGIGEPNGGNVQFAAAPANGAAITIVRNVAATQGLDLAALGSFPAEENEKALDRLTVLAQQLEDGAGRMLRQPDADAASMDALPAAADRAGRLLGFDNDGQPAMSVSTLEAMEAVSDRVETHAATAALYAAETVVVLEAGSDYAAGSSTEVILENITFPSKDYLHIWGNGVAKYAQADFDIDDDGTDTTITFNAAIDTDVATLEIRYGLRSATLGNNSVPAGAIVDESITLTKLAAAVFASPPDLGSGTPAAVAATTLTVSGNATLGDNGSDTITPNGRFAADIDPSSDNARDIGNASLRFKDLFLAGGIYLGGTAAANKLSLFEFGSWTPGLTFGGGSTGMTFAARYGAYVRIGSLVICPFSLQLSAKGSSTGNAAITGLPFTSANVASFAFRSFIGWQQVDLTGFVQLDAETGNSTQAGLYRVPATTANWAATDAGQFNNSSLLAGTIIFQA